MVDQLASADACRICGVPLSKDQFQSDGVCANCAGVPSSDIWRNAQSASEAGTSNEFIYGAQPNMPADPDHPRWGPVTGIVVWLVSVAAVIILPIIAVLLWLVIQSARGAALPNLVVREELLEWLKSPTLLLVQVLSTIVAHAITLVICWIVVTRIGRREFWEGLGWSWAGHSFWYWFVFSACVIVALLIVTQLLARVLPQSDENAFTELLKSSTQVRIAIAVLATFTAPLVEETVYRGILFSSLRKNLGSSATVLLVTVMFTGVHVLQYLGAWVSIAGLMLLSLTMTVVRARTKSILPCVLIHTVNNAFFAVLILLNKAS